MTRSLLSHSPVTTVVWWSVYALASGMLTFGAGYGVAQASGATVAGVLTAAVVMAGAGWWGSPLLGRVQRTLSIRRQGPGPGPALRIERARSS